MSAWTQVKWSEARQVAEAMGLEEDLRPDEGVTPEDYYAQAVSAGEFERAAGFLGHALPRYEAVAWAARLIDVQSRTRKLAPRDQQVLDRILRWLDDPSDEFRREAYEASEQASEEGAERLLAMAVFLSGGSIAPPDLASVIPAPELAGRLAAAAVIVAAHRGEDAAAFLREALASGEKIAAGGSTGRP